MSTYPEWVLKGSRQYNTVHYNLHYYWATILGEVEQTLSKILTRFKGSHQNHSTVTTLVAMVAKGGDCLTAGQHQVWYGVQSLLGQALTFRRRAAMVVAVVLQSTPRVQQVPCNLCRNAINWIVQKPTLGEAR